MKLRIIISVFLVLALIVVVSLISISFLDMDVLKITQADNGKAIALKKGQVFKLALDSNPTTGYQWYIEELDDNIFVITDMGFKPPRTDRVGAGGVQFWKIKAVKVGQSPLKALYYRMWEGKDKAAQSFEVKFAVQ